MLESTPVSADNREDLRDIVEVQTRLVILGDKGYIGESLAENREFVLWL